MSSYILITAAQAFVFGFLGYGIGIRRGFKLGIHVGTDMLDGIMLVIKKFVKSKELDNEWLEYIENGRKKSLEQLLSKLGGPTAAKKTG